MQTLATLDYAIVGVYLLIVIVVCVRADDGGHPAPPHDGQDVVHRMRGVDHDACGVVPHHPDVVVYVEGLPVEAEGARGDPVVDACHGHCPVAGPSRTTTLRSTSPRPIWVKASSTSSRR